MIDNLLTSLLKVVIAIDILGTIGYFILDSIRKNKNRTASPGVLPVVVSVSPSDRKRFPWPGRRSGKPTEGDFAQLQQVLHSFHEGLS
jgi:hypothetical protein